jgi:hypothetical protein
MLTPNDRAAQAAEYRAAYEREISGTPLPSDPILAGIEETARRRARNYFESHAGPERDIPRELVPPPADTSDFDALVTEIVDTFEQWWLTDAARVAARQSLANYLND